MIEIRLRSEVGGLHKIHDTPEIQQTVLEQYTSQRETLIGFELFHQLRHLRSRILDELRFVQNQCAEIEFGKRGEVATKQSVIRDDDIVLQDLLAQIVASGPAFHQ